MQGLAGFWQFGETVRNDGRLGSNARFVVSRDERHAAPLELVRRGVGRNGTEAPFMRAKAAGAGPRNARGQARSNLETLRTVSIEIRGYNEIPFSPAEVMSIRVNHKTWNFKEGSHSRLKTRAACG
jgi:hypothetical protein